VFTIINRFMKEGPYFQ